MTRDYRSTSVVVTKDNPAFAHLIGVMKATKLSHNQILYHMRQDFSKGNYRDELYYRKLVKNRYPHIYSAVPAKVFREDSRGLGKSMTSFFALRKKENTRCRIPGYVKRDTVTVIFSSDAVRKPRKGDEHGIYLSKIPVRVCTSPVAVRNIKEIKVTLASRHRLKVHIVYSVSVKDVKQGNRVAGIDFGVNNLAVVTCDDDKVRPLIIDGLLVKSRNQGTHRSVSKAVRTLHTGHTSKRIQNMWSRRNEFMSWATHSASRRIVDYLVSNDIDEVVIGWNPGWKSQSKKDSTLGRQGNQAFRAIPLGRLKDMIEYKARKHGIRVTVVEESYTSKTSAIAGELPHKQNQYAGKRTHRGLFVVRGVAINADVNASIQIVRKRKPDAFSWLEGVEGLEGLSLARPEKVVLGDSRR